MQQNGEREEEGKLSEISVYILGVNPDLIFFVGEQNYTIPYTSHCTSVTPVEIAINFYIFKHSFVCLFF